jgi:hypothetical protein
MTSSKRGKFFCLAIQAAAVFAGAANPAVAATPGCTHAVVATDPQHLAARLQAAAAAGFRVGALARQDASAPPMPPIVVLTRTVGAAPVELIVEWSNDLGELEAEVGRATAAGAQLRGVARTMVRAPGGASWVAIFERALPNGGAPGPDYRFVLSRGNAAEWRDLEAVAAEGFRVVDVLWWPDPTRSALGEVLFVAERPPGGAPPREVELEWEPVDKLDTALERLAARGWVADVAWTSRDYVNVLLSRPREAAAFQGDRFEVDEDPGLPGVSSMSGRLVERLGFRDGQVAIYDRSEPSEGYALEWGWLSAASWTTPSPAEVELARRLDAAAGDALCAFDAVWQHVPGREPELVVMLRRPPPGP